MWRWARIKIAVLVRLLTVDSVDVVALLGVWQGFRIGPLLAVGHFWIWGHW